MLSDDIFIEVEELMPFLALFKQLTLIFLKTTKLRVSECALEFEDLLVTIKRDYFNRTDLSAKFRLAVQAAHAKLTKYYSKINTPLYSLSIVLDPRFKLRVFTKTQDSAVLTKYARDETEKKFKAYSNIPTEAQGSVNL
jgi:hypothetical protein